MEVTTDMIKELRAATGAGILDCRKALTEAGGVVVGNEVKIEILAEFIKAKSAVKAA